MTFAAAAATAVFSVPTRGIGMATRTARKRGIRWSAIAAVVAVGVAAALSGGAFADTIFVDGDSLAQPPNINIGGAGNRPCSDLGTTIAGAATVKYSGSNHFAAGETVDAVVNPDAAASAAGISTSAGTGVVPSPWTSSSPDFSVGFSTVVPAATPDGTYHVEVGAIGRSSQYDPPGRPQFVINVACGNTGGGGGGGGGGGSTDTTPPVISYTLNPAQPDGSNDWYRGDVTLTWTVTENESPSSLVKTGCVDQNITTDQLPVTYSCSATSDGGSSGPVNVTIKRDGTAPTISASASPSPNGYGWNNTDVTVSFSCDDATSGVASCPASHTLSGEGANQSWSDTAYDNAGNSASAGVSGINIDKTAPSLNVSGAASGTFDICTDGIPSRPSFSPFDGLSGLDGSEGDSWTPSSVASGVGTYTYTAHAQDKAGNPSSETRTYTVQYGSSFSGYLQPINSDGSSRFKLGSTIPVKFRLTCGSTPISNAVAKLYVAKGDSVPDPGVDEAISTAASTTGNLFRYDSTAQQYIFNLSTKLGYTNPASATPVSFSQGSWTLKIGLDDGTYKSINIQLVK
jgi:hypothetical protein